MQSLSLLCKPFLCNKGSVSVNYSHFKQSKIHHCFMSSIQNHDHKTNFKIPVGYPTSQALLNPSLNEEWHEAMKQPVQTVFRSLSLNAVEKNAKLEERLQIVEDKIDKYFTELKALMEKVVAVDNPNSLDSKRILPNKS